MLSTTNAFYAMTKTRKYRLFEANVEVKPSTSSARRVKMRSELGTSSPLRYIAERLAPETAESRAHPDKSKDVWELSVWDPLPISLRMLCFFSPGHVVVYLLFLPLASLDPRPSVTVFNTLLVQILLSVQLLYMSTRYTQQAKDHAIIQKEVMHEYDTKFVQPRLHPIVRDAGTQISDIGPRQIREMVSTGTPTTLIRTGYFTHEQSRVMSEEFASAHSTNVISTRLFTPSTATQLTDTSNSRQSLSTGYTSAATSTPGTGVRQTLPSASTPYGRPSTPGVSIATTTEKLHRTPAGRQSTPGIPTSATTDGLTYSPIRRPQPQINPTAPTPRNTNFSDTNFSGNMDPKSPFAYQRAASLGTGLGESALDQTSPRKSRGASTYERSIARKPSPFAYKAAEAKEPAPSSSPMKGVEAQGSTRPNPFANVRQRQSFEKERYPSRRY